MKFFKPLPLRSLHKRVLLSVSALFKLLYFKPAYLLLALIASLVFYELIFWSLNLGLFHYLLTTEFLTFSDKLEIIIGSYTEVFSLPIAPISSMLFVVSLLQGVAVSALTYTIKTTQKMNRQIASEFGGVGAAGFMSVLGLGCVPCGTSLITPILTFFFATSSAAAAEKVGFYSAILALVISVITVYLSGHKLAAKFKD